MEVEIAETDDKFLSYVNRFIDNELSLIEKRASSLDKQSRFLIYKEAFNKVMI